MSKKFATPGFATIAAGVLSAGFYAVMHVISENVLNDTILALGLMICFYYGLTALACAWYFRHSLFTSVRHFVLRLLCPVLGGVGLFVVFLQTAVDSWAPEFGSGSEIFGVGLVFILGIGILALGRRRHADHGPGTPRVLPWRNAPERHPGPGGPGVKTPAHATGKVPFPPTRGRHLSRLTTAAVTRSAPHPPPAGSRRRARPSVKTRNGRRARTPTPMLRVALKASCVDHLAEGLVTGDVGRAQPWSAGLYVAWPFSS